MPAQPVDATPSSALIRQCFRGRTFCLAVLGQNLARAAFPVDLTLASDLAFVFNASRVRLECCIDPLRPPLLLGKPTRELWARKTRQLRTSLSTGFWASSVVRGFGQIVFLTA